MLDAVHDQPLAWLEAQPALSAVDALQRPLGLHPNRFNADQLRTVQRFMKGRRAAMAREVLLGPLSSTAESGSKAGAQTGIELNVTSDTEMLSNVPS
jgi:hypothetical protein